MTKPKYWLSILAISVVLLAGSIAVSPIAIAGGDDEDDDDDDEKIILTTEDLVRPEFGSGSTFDIENVQCQISQKEIEIDDISEIETTVDWCKATGIMNKVDFADCLETGLTCFVVFADLFESVFAEGADFDKALVEFEVEQLTDEIEFVTGPGDTMDTIPDIVFPEDFKNKSVELEMSVQNDGSSQTKVVVGIEYI